MVRRQFEEKADPSPFSIRAQWHKTPVRFLLGMTGRRRIQKPEVRSQKSEVRI
jgi:hypothetical protein